MIVGNEAKVIERCFNSFERYISAYIINANGTDRTAQIIKDYWAKRSVPGKIHTDAWQNFRDNRNLALEYGSKFIREELKEDPAKWYLLMVDADYVLNIDTTDWVNNLTLPNYSFRHTGYFDYADCRLYRADKPWRYELVTHEFSHLPGENTTSNPIPGVTITHFCDGGHRSEKFERDIRLITEELKRDDIPRNHRVRYTFYLARSYEDLGDYKNAAINYEKRVEFGGWEEETYYSLFKQGRCRAKTAKTLAQKMDAVKVLMNAYYYRPSRLEAIYEAAEFLVDWDFIQLALPLLKICLVTPYPKHDILMIHREVYEWKALYLYTRVTYILGLHEKSLYLHLCLQNDKMPADHKQLLKDKSGEN